ncbi:MAG: ABC transporter permease [Planctomycetes bacterium]|nr:ABC transporter permease [Planctomycetota bacterium]
METASLPIRTVRAEPPGWGSRLAQAVALPSVAARHRALLGAFVRRDIQSRFQGSILGRLWPLLHPAFLFGLYYLVFVSIIPMRFEAAGLTGNQTPPWLFLGVVLWGAFAATVQRSTAVIVDNGNLVKMAAFPSELLPLSVSLAEGVVFALGFGIYAAAHLALGLAVPAKVLLLPVLLAGLYAFSLGLAFLASAAYVFVRDTANLVSVLLLFWMFLTPIFWLSYLIDGVPPTLAAILRNNPMFHVIEGARNLCGLYDAAPLPPPLPWGSIGLVLGSGALVLLLGYAAFLGARRRFVDEI